MMSRRQGRAIAAWLGILALLLDALVPIHLAFDLVGALDASDTHHADDAHVGPSHELLAKLVGHKSHPGEPGGDHHGRADCAVCAATSVLAAFAAPPPAILPAPAAPQPVALATRHTILSGAPPASYRSRAPPFG